MKTQHQLIGLFALLMGPLLMGCTPSHRAVPMIEAGRSLDLVVSVPQEQAYDAAGTLYFRMPAEQGGPYQSRPLTLQGTNLVATLETQTLTPGQSVAYYFDVFAGGEAKSLGSLQYPYVTEIVDATELIERSISSSVSFDKAGLPVVFKLDPAGFAVGKATLSYTIPDLPGVVTQAMAPSQGMWIAEVPGLRVAPGTWTWQIVAEIEGVTYTLPVSDGGFATFTIPPAK
ncbi:MAG: hypothetical protein AAGI37_15785 [Planctomycetota bacterium]